MKILRPLAVALLFACSASAAPVTNSTITLAWEWTLPADLGGLSSQDYLTNVSFQVYASTNLNGPTWTPYALFDSMKYTYLAPTNFTATLPATNAFLFFSATTVTTGGESDFSNRLPILPVQPAGILAGAKGNR